MRNWRTIVGALCIVLAMVLGAFAGFVYARPGAVGASPDVGARGEDRRLVSARELTQTELSVIDEPGMAVSLAGGEPVEIVSPDGASARTLTPTEQRDAKVKSVGTFESKDGTITATANTRGAWPPGTVDAGGPYGGPDAFEGSTTITFTVSAYDPAIIFFRWDFNNDGVFDYPDQTGGGLIGRWTTLTSVDRNFNDNYYGDVVAQGWDGVSTTVTFETGNTLGEPSIYWLLGYGYYTFAHEFKAKMDLRVTQLGVYRYGYNIYDVGLWSSSGALLGTCTPPANYYTWNWCTLPSAVDLVMNGDYRIGIAVQYYASGINLPPDTTEVHFAGTYYCYSGSSSLCFPSNYWTNQFIPMNDIVWEKTLIIPDVAQDEALLQVVNVAPSVFDVSSSPNPGLEGNPTFLVANFYDPGLDDTWESRWLLPSGDWSPWVPVSKFNGGAKVLVLHTWSDIIGTLMTTFKNGCGAYCTRIEDFDYGPLGNMAVPEWSYVSQFDLIIVGTNYFDGPNAEVGDLLADFIDSGRNVLMMQAGFDTSYGDRAGIGGRWESDGYSPIERGGANYGSSGLGSIYVPGHPFFDGVASLTGGLRAMTYGVTAGAEHIADWADGTTLAATKMTGSGMACALNLFPYQSYGYISGDWVQLVMNAIRYCAQQPDPTYRTMPLSLDPYPIIFPDDEPTTTTPVDTFPVAVQVRDDDDGKLEIHDQTEFSSEDFQVVSDCSGQYYSYNTWPSGWSSDPNPYGWTCGANSYGIGRSPYILWYFNDPSYGTGDGHSYLYTPSFDMTGFGDLSVEYYTNWDATYNGMQNGFIEASTDGGATWPYVLKEYIGMDISQYVGDDSGHTTGVADQPNVIVRFRYESNDDYWWAVDNIRFSGVTGTTINGLGEGSGMVTIANVPPTTVGGFDSALRTEAQELVFKGYTVSDPALIMPTEWFAYRWDMGDGTPTEWTYMGSLAPPRLDILIVHTLCLGPISSTCADLNGLVNTLLAQDDVGTVDYWDYINYPALPTAPTLSTMLQYDVIIVVTNWAYYSYAPFDVARRQVGDRLADYLDSGRGGAVTAMAVYDTSGGSDLFMIRGRYIEDDYGAFEKTDYGFTVQTGLGTIYDPTHDVFTQMSSGYKVGSMYISSGDYKLTVSGGGLAAGMNGELLADWPNGNSAIGVKTLQNGARSVNFGGFGNPTGADAAKFWRNSVGWASGGIPSPKIPDFSYNYGDNGIYTVDLALIDDDMGWVWDTASNMPALALPGQESVAHKFVTVTVDNVDPTIASGSVEAYIAALVCVRVTGQEGNTVSLAMYTDGGLTTTVTTTRLNGDPNPPTEKCGLLKVDVLAPHSYAAEITYSNPEGGSNPTWVIIAPWKEPVTPGHGTVSYKYDLETAGTTSLALPTLKADLFAKGDGAKIDFVAEAYDPGTDDLAFFWAWGTEDGIVYEPSADSVYTIHVHHNSGMTRTDGTLAGTQYLGYSEPYFDRGANDERSPIGTMNFRVRDTATHAFEGGQGYYYVFLMVLDDDNGRGYESPFGLDGIDIESIVVDLT